MDKTKHEPEPPNDDDWPSQVPPNDDDWPSQVFRDQIVRRLETEIQSNVHVEENAREMEQRIFMKYLSKAEYMSSITAVIEEMRREKINKIITSEQRWEGPLQLRRRPRSPDSSGHIEYGYASQTLSASSTQTPRPGSLSLQAPWSGSVGDSGGRPETSPWLSDQSTKDNILDAATGMTPRRDSLHDYFLPLQDQIRKAAIQQQQQQQKQAPLGENSSQAFRWPGGDHPTTANRLDGEFAYQAARSDEGTYGTPPPYSAHQHQRLLQEIKSAKISLKKVRHEDGRNPAFTDMQTPHSILEQLNRRTGAVAVAAAAALRGASFPLYQSSSNAQQTAEPVIRPMMMGYGLPPLCMPPQHQQQIPIQFISMDRSSVYESMKMPSDDESVPRAKRDPEGKWLEEDFESETDGASGAAMKSTEVDSSSESETEVETIRQQIIDIINGKANIRKRNRSRQRKLFAIPSEAKTVFVSKFAEDFTPKGLLGVGRIGCVFSAESRLDCSEYAVKRISVSSSENVIEKILRGVRAISQLDHPAIIRFHSTWIERPPKGWQQNADIEMSNNWKDKKVRKYSKINFFLFQMPNDDDADCVLIYIQMQMCSYSLETWLSKNSDQSLRPLNTIKLWFIQIVSAIGYLHGKSLVHRNLKPSNILFVKEDRVKVSDIDIVTEFTEEVNDNQRPELYRSPEHGSRVRPWECTAKTDIFALGLIFAECCVVMTDEERGMEFDSYRNKVCSDVLSNTPDAELFVHSLTDLVASDRPTCKKILQNKFLTNFDQDLVYASKYRDVMDELQLPYNATYTVPALSSTSIHQKSRLSEKRYHCPIPNCNVSYDKSSHLIPHINVHNKHKPYKCQKPGCEEAFYRNDLLNRHIRGPKHEEIKDVPCRFCPKMFRRRDNRNEHEKRAHPDQNF